MLRDAPIDRENLGLIAARLLRVLRERRGLSRGQVARKLKITTAVLYNLETGRSRIPLGLFGRAMSATGIDPSTTFAECLRSVRREELARRLFNQPDHLVTSGFTQLMRQRLNVTQKSLAESLGYSSAAIVHHFEKGIREASIVDAVTMMILARDDARKLITEIDPTPDGAALAKSLPAGHAVESKNWDEYWSRPWIAAMRQIMRSDFWRSMKRYEFGYFADLLGITLQEERAALKVMTDLEIIKWQNAKPDIDPEVRIVVPRGIAKATLDAFKRDWIMRLADRASAVDAAKSELMSVDLIPANQETFAAIKQLVRETQDKIHSMPLVDTDGFVCMGWLGGYIQCKNPGRKAPKRLGGMD